jgi:hypothetical protein
VRRQVQPDNSVRKEARATGQLKPAKRTYVEAGHNHYLILRALNGQRERMLWDTGATYTTISTRIAKKLGLLTQAGQLAAGYTAGANSFTTIADGSQVPVRSVLRVPFTVARTGELIHGRVNIMPGDGASSLMGTSHIRQVKTMKIKFK